MGDQHIIVCNLVGEEQEFMAHSMLRVPDELAFKLQVSEFAGNVSPIKPDIPFSDDLSDQFSNPQSKDGPDRRQYFMQLMSQYINNSETRYNWKIFELVINEVQANPKDCFFIFRK